MGYYSEEWEATAMRLVNEERAIRGMPVVVREDIGIYGNSEKKDEWIATTKRFAREHIDKVLKEDESKQ